jgi:hypothetical protein
MIEVIANTTEDHPYIYTERLVAGLITKPTPFDWRLPQD